MKALSKGSADVCESSQSFRSSQGRGTGKEDMKELTCPNLTPQNQQQCGGPNKAGRSSQHLVLLCEVPGILTQVYL